MFVVKATYRGETRKVSFPHLNTSFPSFEALSGQVTKVFSLKENVYFSQVLFATDARFPDRRILLAKAIHTAEEYENHISGLERNTWVSPLLRFDVLESPHHQLYNPAYLPSYPERSVTDAAPPAAANTQPQAQVAASQEVRGLITSFKKDLNVVLSKAFGPEAQNLWESPTEATMSPRLQPCRTCNKLCSDSQTSCQECVGSASMNTPQAGSSTLSSAFSTLLGASTSRLPARTQGSATHRMVHRGIRCDACGNMPVGIRHKCLECPDYDLCDECIEKGRAEEHNPFHEFIDILEPGRVVVHTVRDRSDATPAHPVPASVPTPAAESAIHNATCDLCDSLIRGNRYKCVGCPDFDTCERCFTIIPEQHPGHSFVRLGQASDLIRGPIPDAGMHYATCNECSRHIYGTRYKCMHPSCPDYDLCGSCEALPIAVHPANHPLLKMKTADTAVPTVYRVGPVNLIPAPSVSLPVPRAQTPRPAASPTVDEVLAFVTSMTPPPAPIVPPTPESVAWSAAPSTSNETVPPLPPKPSFPHGYAPWRAPSEEVQAYETSRPSSPVVPGAFQYDFRSYTPSVTSTSREDALERHLSWKADRGVLSSAPVPEVETEQNGWKNVLSGLDHLVKADLDEEEQAKIRYPVLEASKVAVVSPLTGNEALLSRPISPAALKSNTRSKTSLDALLSGYESTSSSQCSAVENEKEFSAAFITDVTVTDGQVFPPGAEFMKCWKMKNDGMHDWSEDTVMAFVGGKGLLKSTSDASFSVGKLAKGESMDLWTGELKAPERPGKYVAYWRLKDGNGNAFGDSVWVDITVAEPDDSSEGMNSSSLMMMPSAVQATNSANSGAMYRVASGATEDATAIDDDAGSDSSDMSLLSVPSSTLSDEAHWEDSRGAVPAASRRTSGERDEFVVLFDENSSSEEE